MEIITKTYPSYAAYLAHQAEKLDKSNGHAFTNPEKQVELFRQRFLDLPIPKGQTVLCLGARCGEEVRAWFSVGHHAVGIDVNPGKDNPYVTKGDFHHLPQDDHSVDVVYTNCLDHALDLGQVLKEVTRVLRPHGWFVVDMVYGYDEGHTQGEHDVMHWSTADGFARTLQYMTGMTRMLFRDLTDLGSPLTKQAVLTW